MRCSLTTTLLIFALSLGFTRADCSDGSCSPDEPSRHIIALTSCNGFVGRRLVDALSRLYPRNAIRCLVRRGTTKAMDGLADLESVRYVDFLDESSISSALVGTKSVYVNTPPKSNVLQMRENIAKACEKTKDMEHIVLLGEPVDVSWYGLSDFWDDHRAGVEALERTGLQLTVLHPSWFLDPFPVIVGHDIFQRVGMNPAPYSSVEDVVDVAARVLVEGPGRHGWKRYSLINEVMTGPEIANAMSEATGRHISYIPISLDDFWKGMRKAPGITEKEAEGYALAMALNDRGVYTDGDLGQLKVLLGYEPRTAVDVFRSMRHFFNLNDGVEGNESRGA